MTASFLEVVQVLVAGLGALMILIRTMPDAEKNRDTIREKYRKDPDHYRGRLAIAEKNLMFEQVFLSAQAVLFFVGLWTWFIAPPPYLPDSLMDVSGKFTDDEIRHIVLDNRHAVTAKKIAMMSVSLVLTWASRENCKALNVINAERANDPLPVPVRVIVPGGEPIPVEVVADASAPIPVAVTNGMDPTAPQKADGHDPS